MVTDRMFSDWMGVFESRLGKPLDDFTFRAYYATLRDQFADDAEFHRAATRVFAKHEWNTWPAPIEFMSAAAMNRRIPDAEIKATYAQYIAPARQLPAPKSDAIDRFAADWRAQLAHCAPDRLAAERLAQIQTPDGRDPWLTDERRAPLAPPAGPMPGPSLEQIAAEDAA